MDINTLLQDDEILAFFGITTAYTSYTAITKPGNTDISAALEDTLHRILDAGGTAEDVRGILGAFIPTEEELSELEEFDEYINIDLSYVIDGLITYWAEVTMV